MAYPFFPPFKTIYLQASSTSTADGQLAVVVPARSKYVGLGIGYGFTASQTGTSTVNLFAVLGSTGAAQAAFFTTDIAVTTSTGGGQFFASANTTAAVPFFNAGDMINTVYSTLAHPTFTHVLQEF